jgi:hypothetical protein
MAYNGIDVFLLGTTTYNTNSTPVGKRAGKQLPVAVTHGAMLRKLRSYAGTLTLYLLGHIVPLRRREGGIGPAAPMIAFLPWKNRHSPPSYRYYTNNSDTW